MDSATFIQGFSYLALFKVTQFTEYSNNLYATLVIVIEYDYLIHKIKLERSVEILLTSHLKTTILFTITIVIYLR